jgi:hypothetical protein
VLGLLQAESPSGSPELPTRVVSMATSNAECSADSHGENLFARLVWRQMAQRHALTRDLQAPSTRRATSPPLA